MLPTLEQNDFPIKTLDLPTPITANIFGVRLILHVPSQVFPYLHSNLSSNFNSYSLAALSEWLPLQFAPTTFMNILNQSIIFLQSNHECNQYIDDSFIFLSNAFPDCDAELILNALESFDGDLCNTALYLNQEYVHVSPNPDSALIEILNPYASHQIKNLLAFDTQYQQSALAKSNSNDLRPQMNENKGKSRTLNLDEEYKAAEKHRQEKEDASIALALKLQMEEEDLLEIHKSKLRKVSKEDEDYARTLQAHLEEEEIAEKKKREEEENMIDCCCCYMPYPIIEMVPCPEGHLTCRRCIQMSIETALGEGRVRTDCPCVDGCNSKISMRELERVLPENLIKRLNETESLNAISEMDIPGLQTCWRCGYKVIDESEDSPFICPKCNEETCKKCGKKHHQGRTCEEADLDPNRIVEKKMSEAIVKQCPKCHTQFIKDEGCNHMTCPRCHTEFCYLCGKIINGQVSKHYKTCAQFMDNAKYNDEQVQNARRNAMKDLGMP